jgi:hypothetical protein
VLVNKILTLRLITFLAILILSSCGNRTWIVDAWFGTDRYGSGDFVVSSNIESGTYDTAQTVELAVIDSIGKHDSYDDPYITYTTDGSEPTSDSTVYTDPITVALGDALYLRAKAFMNTPHTPIISEEYTATIYVKSWQDVLSFSVTLSENYPSIGMQLIDGGIYFGYKYDAGSQYNYNIDKYDISSGSPTSESQQANINDTEASMLVRDSSGIEPALVYSNTSNKFELSVTGNGVDYLTGNSVSSASSENLSFIGYKTNNPLISYIDGGIIHVLYNYTMSLDSYTITMPDDVNYYHSFDSGNNIYLAIQSDTNQIALLNLDSNNITDVTPTGNSYNGKAPSVHEVSNTPYIAYADEVNSKILKLAKGIDEGDDLFDLEQMPSYETSYSINRTNIYGVSSSSFYIATTSDSGSINVYHYNNGTWATMGQVGSTNHPDDVRIVVKNDIPYVLYSNTSNKLKFVKFD